MVREEGTPHMGSDNATGLWKLTRETGGCDGGYGTSGGWRSSTTDWRGCNDFNDSWKKSTGHYNKYRLEHKGRIKGPEVCIT